MLLVGSLWHSLLLAWDGLTAFVSVSHCSIYGVPIPVRTLSQGAATGRLGRGSNLDGHSGKGWGLFYPRRCDVGWVIYRIITPLGSEHSYLGSRLVRAVSSSVSTVSGRVQFTRTAGRGRKGRAAD